MSPRFLSLSLLPLQTMALHIAFIAPPASHYVPMLPIAHQLLEEGHNVSFLGIKDTTKKLSKTVPKAHFHTLEADDDLSSKKKAMPYIQGLSYYSGQFFTQFAISMMGNIVAAGLLHPAKQALMKLKPDVLCVPFLYPPFYALAEVLNIPVVGIGWGTPSFLTQQVDLPWSLEPAYGSVLSRQEVSSDISNLFLNLVPRIFSFFTLRLGSMINMVHRFKLGHPRPLEPWEFDCTIQNPMIAMTLPEFTSGYPSLVGPYTFMVGILDHPAMGGSSIWKSDDEQHIMDWLDEREAKKDKVLYVAFGSEVTVTEELMRLLAGAFKKAASHFKVLYANKVKPSIDFPEGVLVTKFAPQRAVLAHSAVFAFLSHGGANSVNEALMVGKPMVIMPFFGDQMSNAIVNQELGVAVFIPKDTDEAGLLQALDRIADKRYAIRSAQVKELNNQRKDMSRAVEVIVNHGSGRFRMNTPAPPAMWTRFVPIAITLALLFFWLRFCFFVCASCIGCCFKRKASVRKEGKVKAKRP